MDPDTKTRATSSRVTADSASRPIHYMPPPSIPDLVEQIRWVEAAAHVLAAVERADICPICRHRLGHATPTGGLLGARDGHEAGCAPAALLDARPRRTA